MAIQFKTEVEQKKAPEVKLSPEKLEMYGLVEFSFPLTQKIVDIEVEKQKKTQDFIIKTLGKKNIDADNLQNDPTAILGELSNKELEQLLNLQSGDNTTTVEILKTAGIDMKELKQHLDNLYADSDISLYDNFLKDINESITLAFNEFINQGK